MATRALTYDPADTAVGYFRKNADGTTSQLAAAAMLTALGGGPSASHVRTLYVETTGNNGTAEIGNPAKPYATAQAAFNAAYTAWLATPTLYFLLKFGIGTSAQFGGVSTATPWPSFIRVCGAGETVTTLGNIATTANADTQINLRDTLRRSLSFGTITSGNHSDNSKTANITLTDVRCGNVTAGIAASTPAGGAITIAGDCRCGNLTTTTNGTTGGMDISGTSETGNINVGTSVGGDNSHALTIYGRAKTGDITIQYYTVNSTSINIGEDAYVGSISTQGAGSGHGEIILQGNASVGEINCALVANGVVGDILISDQVTLRGSVRAADANIGNGGNIIITGSPYILGSYLRGGDSAEGGTGGRVEITGAPRTFSDFAYSTEALEVAGGSSLDSNGGTVVIRVPSMVVARALGGMSDYVGGLVDLDGVTVLDYCETYTSAAMTLKNCAVAYANSAGDLTIQGTAYGSLSVAGTTNNIGINGSPGGSPSSNRVMA